MIEIISGGGDAIIRIERDWSALCIQDSSISPFVHPEWFAAFAKTFRAKIELITVRNEGRLDAVLPVVKKRGLLNGFPVRKVQAVYNLNTQRFDLAHCTDESQRKPVAAAIWKGIKQIDSWDVSEFRLVERNSWIADVVHLAEKEGYCTGIWQMDNAPYISLATSQPPDQAITEFFKGSRKHLKQELNRRLRRLKEIGNVEFAVSHIAKNYLLETFFELESRGWKGRRGSSVRNDPMAATLHRDFTFAIEKSMRVLVYELKLDGKTIAMNINIQNKDHLTHWKTTYDEEFSRYSPGNLLFRELVNDCFHMGIQEIDFLSPATPNKAVWATGERQHVAFYIFRRGILGKLLHLWKFNVVAKIREFLSLTPKPLDFKKTRR